MRLFTFLKKKNTPPFTEENEHIEKKVTIHLQNSTRAERGTVEKYWFENGNIGLAKTLFHRITIPLTPFDSAIEYESQPVNTSLIIDWLNLELSNPDDLDRVILNGHNNYGADGSIYLGSAHNPFDITEITLRRISEAEYQINGNITIDFEHERVASNEDFTFETTLQFLSRTDHE